MTMRGTFCSLLAPGGSPAARATCNSGTSARASALQRSRHTAPAILNGSGEKRKAVSSRLQRRGHPATSHRVGDN